MRVLVTGGVRSGKSCHAESLLTGPVTYLAPGPVQDGADWAARIAAHRARRPVDWTTVESHDLVGVLARTDGHVMVDCLGTWLTAVLDERGQTLARDHAGDVPAIAIDAPRVRQVVWNLLDNAAKASPAGATIALHTRREGDRVAIDVIDHGAGIAAADLPRIFEPFFTTRPDGTGLGLAICQKVVRGHGGEIVVRSQPGQGSTFSIVLPAA